jgi:Caspase domain
MPDTPEVARGTTLIRPTETPPAGKNYLLGIGIDVYASPNLRPLRNAVRDVEAVVALLAEGYQFAQPGESDQTQLLLNEEATRQNIIAHLDEYAQLVKAPDNLVIYFAGHGEADGPRGYWIPHDGLAKGQRGHQASWMLCPLFFLRCVIFLPPRRRLSGGKRHPPPTNIPMIIYCASNPPVDKFKKAL